MNSTGPVFRAAVMAIAWVIWMSAFFVRAHRHHEEAVQKDPKARWGMAFQMAGYALVFMHGPEAWSNQLGIWRLAAGAILALVANVSAWRAVGNLGRQWRVDAGLNRDHELIQTGAYSIVRHPIYASMLGMFLATTCWIGTLPGWPIGLVLFIAGVEIRVRVEDNLLQARFGARFEDWKRAVPAYIPLIR